MELGRPPDVHDRPNAALLRLAQAPPDVVEAPRRVFPPLAEVRVAYALQRGVGVLSKVGSLTETGERGC